MSVNNLFSLSEDFSKKITINYSTSFSMALRLIDKKYRQDIYNIYGFVRTVDELVDSIKPMNSLETLNSFEKDLYVAIESEFSLNPIVYVFVSTVKKYNIDISLIKSFLKSMRSDVTKKNYSDVEFKDYIYGSAEVIGLICLNVFCKNKVLRYKLSPSAKALGSAFQKINFLRDFGDDFNNNQRIYFPGVSYTTFSNDQKKIIEKDIEKDLLIAKKGILKLPYEFKYANLLAFKYYQLLLKKIQKTDVKSLKNKRVRVSNTKKIILYLEVNFFKLLHL